MRRRGLISPRRGRARQRPAAASRLSAGHILAARLLSWERGKKTGVLAGMGERNGARVLPMPATVQRHPGKGVTALSRLQLVSRHLEVPRLFPGVSSYVSTI